MSSTQPFSVIQAIADEDSPSHSFFTAKLMPTVSPSNVQVTPVFGRMSESRYEDRGQCVLCSVRRPLRNKKARAHSIVVSRSDDKDLGDTGTVH